MSVKLICAHCKETFCLDDDETLESGMTLTCNHCRQDTIVELFKPEDRKQLYKIAYKSKNLTRNLLESTGSDDSIVRKEERGK